MAHKNYNLAGYFCPDIDLIDGTMVIGVSQLETWTFII